MNPSSSSNGPTKTLGIPSTCWCGASVVSMISKSDRNPYRRFYRCVYAVSEKLFDDNHIFKWIEEALVDEIGILHNSIDRVDNLIMEELESVVMSLGENFVMEKVEKMVKERVEKLVSDKLEELVTEKLEKLVREKVENLVLIKLDNLVMEKIQEEILCMKLSE